MITIPSNGTKLLLSGSSKDLKHLEMQRRKPTASLDTPKSQVTIVQEECKWHLEKQEKGNISFLYDTNITCLQTATSH